ncbi:hypothetical protein DFA_07074 [Cavenderia fasciculata]|uniref:Uncharacterized protein n=1 Tax=Cavenderia fasciculata TaxID=261658 RepID=F4PVE9_CACFS|nr:uncharacterized protein DFA_07074 [Cavenderia fasciculata]EGG19963.1 hypothetical protein DFA_07074 [Cavenderia fasciculata]|eukprot:XP_004366946.1 hypothetical protein DFA_07074 [Cavenderia fasciculata]
MTDQYDDDDNQDQSKVTHKIVSREEQSKYNRRKAPVSMCQDVRVAAFRCSERNPRNVKTACSLFFDAYQKFDAPPLKRITMKNRLKELDEERSQQYPVPDTY